MYFSYTDIRRTTMAVTTSKAKTEGVTWRRYKDGESLGDIRSAQDMIFQAGWTHKCPEYMLSTPPCQGSCPAGEDIRGYLNIARGIEKPPAGVTWQEDGSPRGRRVRKKSRRDRRRPCRSGGSLSAASAWPWRDHFRRA